MNSFSITTLGCKVNHYESEQIAAFLRSRGLTQVDPAVAQLRVINTCSVTTQAASKSRQTVRRTTRHSLFPSSLPAPPTRTRVIVTGCWATGSKAQAAQLPGVDAVLGHHDDVAAQLARLLDAWADADQPAAWDGEALAGNGEAPAEPLSSWKRPLAGRAFPAVFPPGAQRALPSPTQGDGSGAAGEMTLAAADLSAPTGRHFSAQGNALGVPETKHLSPEGATQAPGVTSLPLLDQRQTGRQRAFLKIQDGCDAHCTYCIIPQLRPRLWSKPSGDVLEEARRLVAAGHVELVLTGVFLGAYGQPTALHRRQSPAGGALKPLAALIQDLCTHVPGLRRLRLSSLEPADLSDDLLGVLACHQQVVPHFHLPLQSGSDQLLKMMNRQYRRDDFLRMVQQVRHRFDRPALTTDIIVGFPGETDHEFQQTLDVVQQVGFIHIHAFSYSPRPGTPAARWQGQFVPGLLVNQRIQRLQELAREHSLAFRSQFLGQFVQLLVERPSPQEQHLPQPQFLRHGRCERYFSVFFDGPQSLVGQCVRVRIDRVTPQRTLGSLCG